MHIGRLPNAQAQRGCQTDKSLKPSGHVHTVDKQRRTAPPVEITYRG